MKIFWFAEWNGIFMPVGDALFANIVTFIIGVIFWLTGFLIFLVVKLFVEGFKALFEGDILRALVYWGLLAVLGWGSHAYLGGDRLVSAIQSGQTGSIKGYFVYPNNNHNCSSSPFSPTPYYLKDMPGKMRESVTCSDGSRNVRYMRWENQETLSAYLQQRLAIANEGTKKANVIKREGPDGEYFEVTSGNCNCQLFLWSKEEYFISAEIWWGGYPLESTESIRKEWFTLVAAHR